MASSQQQPEVEPGIQAGGAKPQGGAPEGFETEDARRQREKARSERARQKQALNLQRENILSQKTSNPARRSALEAALAQIEAEIEAMG